jgi:hypothetical protein
VVNSATQLLESNFVISNNLLAEMGMADKQKSLFERKLNRFNFIKSASATGVIAAMPSIRHFLPAVNQ